MAKPNVIILTGYGINCYNETKYAFDRAGANSELVHINDLIDNHKKLSNYQIFTFPGGFSYGDDTGAGNALANRIRNHLFNDIKEFVEKDKLLLGICNGFQVMVNLGLLPALDKNYGNRQVALLHNDSARYIDRWVDLEFSNDNFWTKDINRASFPIAHGEGKLFAPPAVLKEIKEKGLISAKYVYGEICKSQSLQANPNGSLEDIAAISDESGRLLGMMPHPERAISFTQHPYWTLLKEQYKRSGREIPSELDGLKIFKNAVEYFS